MKHLSGFLVLFTITTMFFTCPAFSYVNKNIAVLRVLNKAAGKTKVIQVPVDDTIVFDKLTISVRACKQTDPFDAENHFAFVEIFDSDKQQIFGNWMNKNEPGKNPLENQDWDVWLVNCTD